MKGRYQICDAFRQQELEITWDKDKSLKFFHILTRRMTIMNAICATFQEGLREKVPVMEREIRQV